MASKPQQPAAPFADDVSHSHFEFSSAIWPSRAQQFSDCLICFLGVIFSLSSELEVYEALGEFFWVIGENKQNFIAEFISREGSWIMSYPDSKR